MNYTLMIAKGDYGVYTLDKSGCKYVVECYIYGYKVTLHEEYGLYDIAETRFMQLCMNSNVTPERVEHDINDIMAFVD